MGKKVRIASIGLNVRSLGYRDQREVTKLVFDKLETVRGYAPDLVILPEAFPISCGDADDPDWAEIADSALKYLREFARENHCYLIAPLFERMEGQEKLRYNTAYLIDRAGNIQGKYRKVHTVDTEQTVHMVMPGSDFPVFDTDFGRIGIQICFDIGWREGWKLLADQGAKVIIWTSAYDGGNLLNTYAAYHMVWVVSSVRSDHPRVIDPTGRTLAQGSRWNGILLCEIDPETELFHVDNQYGKIDALRAALGDKVTIHAYDEENVFTVESNDPDWSMERIKREFGLVTYREYHEQATKIQNEWREKYGGLGK